MKIAIYTLTEKEVKEQKQYIKKYEALIDKEFAMRDLMNVENIKNYSQSIKKAHDLIVNGITYDNEFMIEQLKNKPNVQIKTI